ncbi:DUF6350 family protein [Nocardia sp. SYP-A9097]|uniref:cell division protein PerM n=1 Tax=Nocardia sp. SYP-A9097 TaxID=2663237 RepID=UPI002816373F|nr:DUF6350 family protein [Nocardia sp. SYP-A9097]
MTDEDVRERPRGPVSVGGGGFGSLTPERARVLFLLAARASAFVLLIIFAVVFGTLLAAGSGLSGASGAISASWLAVHQVPLTIGRTGIGLWPLLPTGLMLWLVARDCAKAADHCAAEADCTPVDLAWIAGAAIGGPLLVTAVCLAVADDASAVLALQPPDTLVAFAWVIGLHLLAVIAGVGARHWRDFTDLLPIPLPHWVVPGVRAGIRAVWRLLGVAAVLTVVSFLLHWSRIGDTYHSAGNIAGALGLTLLSLAYLPNALVDTAGVLLGGQVQIGAGSLSLFGIEGAPVPAVPLMAAVPSGPVAAWWLVFLLAPAAVGVLGGLDCGRGTDDRPTAPWATLTSAAVAAVLIALLGGLAGGDLGTFGRIGPEVAISAALAFVWFAVTGYVGMLGARWFAPAAVGTAAGAAEYDYDDGEYEYADDEYDDDYAEDDYYADDEYEDDYYDDDDPGHVVEVDGELLDEPDALDPEPHAESDENSDIVDAEVVEGDLPDNPEVDGR